MHVLKLQFAEKRERDVTDGPVRHTIWQRNWNNLSVWRETDWKCFSL